MLRVCSPATVSTRCLRERPGRSSFPTTSGSPSRALARASDNPSWLSLAPLPQQVRGLCLAAPKKILDKGLRACGHMNGGLCISAHERAHDLPEADDVEERDLAVARVPVRGPAGRREPVAAAAAGHAVEGPAAGDPVRPRLYAEAASRRRGGFSVNTGAFRISSPSGLSWRLA